MNNDLISVRITEKRYVAHNIVHIVLQPADNQTLPRFTPGSHIDLHINAGTGKPLIRQYSLLNAPDSHQCYEIAVLLEAHGRGGSKAVHQQLNEGDLIQISPPRNLFPLLPDEDETLLFAGGIGITPILSMAHALQQRQAKFSLHYFAKSIEHAAFAHSLMEGPFSHNVNLCFDDGSADSFDPQSVLKEAAKGRHLYICGPQGFINFITDSARAYGWDNDNIHFELFSQDLSAANDDNAGFQIRIASSGQLIDIGADQTVLEALEEQGFEIPCSCEQGVCGTCLLPVIEGTPDHRDMYLSDAEKQLNNQFTPCCSRALSDCLVLDL
ncbi:vanillate O-demethylase ferredoxin subunit [Amphritea atlantica]|uniref:Vanillate O-demethylase ferredoxin subunit n=1 Tax=Amphritea atlantica TaxID=355243 RepID=A0A1H9EBR6_9GAMM|nr:PDR/VanB family oxidoreductase [Amphritea atlantica]SEQ23206.1 vanillate O-demethylase ferredoxin subunit [Amphritea atlantica]